MYSRLDVRWFATIRAGSKFYWLKSFLGHIQEFKLKPKNLHKNLLGPLVGEGPSGGLPPSTAHYLLLSSSLLRFDYNRLGGRGGRGGRGRGGRGGGNGARYLRADPDNFCGAGSF